jgi:hypothetical protein
MACLNTADNKCGIIDIFVLQVVMTYITEVSLTNEGSNDIYHRSFTDE